MKKAALVGCGYLGTTIAAALSEKAVPNVELVGLYSRTFEKAENLSRQLSVPAVKTFEELLDLSPHYIIEAASPKAVTEIAIPSLKAGADLLLLSTGAFSQDEFYRQVLESAELYDRHVYLVPGAVGGFDILNAAKLAGAIKTTITVHKFPAASSCTDPMSWDAIDCFSGSVAEAYQKAPNHLNVAVSVALATNGLQDTAAKIESGDSVNFTIDCQGDFGRASIYTQMTKERKLIAYSAISLLQRLNLRITF